MFSIATLLDAAKAKVGLESDYRLAKVLRINQTLISNWRHGRNLPAVEMIEALCALSGDDCAVVMAQIQAERERTPEAKNMWLMVAARLRGAASTAILSVLFAISLIAGYAEPVRASGLNVVKTACVKCLYIVSNTILSVPVFLMVRLRLFPGLLRLCAFAALA